MSGGVRNGGPGNANNNNNSNLQAHGNTQQDKKEKPHAETHAEPITNHKHNNTQVK